MTSNSLSVKSKKLFNNVGSAISAKPTFSILIFIFVSFILSRIAMYLVYRHTLGAGGFVDVITAGEKFDSAWYITYVRYFLGGPAHINVDNGQAIWVFFPLMPYVMSLIVRLLGGNANIFVVGFFVNSIFFMAAEYVAYKYIMLTTKRIELAFYYVFFMSFGLYSFYFSALYTEALFLLLITLCFYFLKKKNYILMGVFGALLSATRNVGIMFVFVVLFEVIEEYIHMNSIKKKSFWDFIKVNVSNEKLIFGTFLVPLGLFSYMFYLYKKVGDSLAFLHIERAWGRTGNVVPFRDAKRNILDTFPPTYLGVCFVIIVVFILYVLIHEKKFTEMVFPIITLIVGASSKIGSTPRYVLGCFVVVLSFVGIYSRLSKTARVFIALFAMAFEMILLREWFLNNGLLT